MAATPRVGVLAVDRAPACASPPMRPSSSAPNCRPSCTRQCAACRTAPRANRNLPSAPYTTSTVWPDRRVDGRLKTMWIKRLKVTDWAGIAAAAIDFDPGLNVLHGPNELGKSSLVTAIRAALLLQSTSAAAEPWRDWHADAPPEVSLTFDQGSALAIIVTNFNR